MKRYILGMSLEKDKAISQIKPFSNIIMEHAIKLVVYSDIRPNDVNGWIRTIATWLHRADDITVKPHARKLKSQDIMESLFGAMGDEVKDYRRALYSFLADNSQGKFNTREKTSYPDFEVSDELAYDLMQVCQDIIETSMPMLVDKQDHSIDEYEAKIKDIFN